MHSEPRGEAICIDNDIGKDVKINIIKFKASSGEIENAIPNNKKTFQRKQKAQNARDANENSDTASTQDQGDAVSSRSALTSSENTLDTI